MIKRLHRTVLLLLLVVVLCPMAQAEQNQIVKWTISNARVVSQGTTIQTPQGTLVNGYVVTAKATSSANPLIRNGDVRIVVSFFSPAKSGPGLAQGQWYAKGTWSLSDPSAPESSQSATRSPDVIRGALSGNYPAIPGSSVSLFSMVMPLSLTMGPAAGHWAKGTGTLSGTADFNGVLSAAVQTGTY